ncbi:zinc finger protein 646-like [Lolium rigidum]|uniref:zinc finger protein 646-like n=1 Tax=Lolium rigidum TaxID=89674 RepID=UPI001F5DF5B0|nr:zinc finger protein 646-like [Lolium rigidum]
MPSSPSPPRPSPPQAAYKHFCRVCNKGFTCGSALGGHMRAHAVGDDGPSAADDDDEPVPRARGGGGEDGPSTATTTHVYALRANPNRLTRGCQVCKNCGKEFSSMELFLEHGKCNSGENDDTDGSPHSSAPSVADGEDDASLATAWSKGKRSRRAKLGAEGGDDMPAGEDEEEDLANCLVMLSSCKADQAGVSEADPQPRRASASKDHVRMPQQPQPISFVMPAPEQAMVMPLALPAPLYASPVPRGMFECKACKKVFTSHQALGGHRASHKKVKGCFAAKAESSVIEPMHHAPAASGLDDDKGSAAAAVEVNAGGSADARTNVDVTAGETHAGTSEAAAAPSLSMAITTTDHDPALAITPGKKKAKMHECSVCHRLFSSGQALGGHKRCHWLTSGTGEHANIAPLTAEGLVAASGQQLTLRPMVDASEPVLDLTIAANPLTAIASARVAEVGTSSLHLDASAPSLYLQPAAVPSNPSNQNKMAPTSSHGVDDAVAASCGAEDEADSTTVKKARLCDLKDDSTAGETTPWLQVGIGSSSADGDGKSAAE